jgi:DNA-binding XRE family transcriptional regulator
MAKVVKGNNINSKKTGSRTRRPGGSEDQTEITILSADRRAFLIEGIQKIKAAVAGQPLRTKVTDPDVRRQVLELYRDALILMKEPQNSQYIPDLLYYFELVMWLGGKEAGISEGQIENEMPSNLDGFREATERIEEIMSYLEEGTLEHLGDLKEANLVTMASLIYQVARETVSKNTFQQVEGIPWPTALFQKGNSHGEIQLRPISMDDLDQLMLPPEKVEEFAVRMWEQREELSDLDADVLDVLSHIWLEQVTSPKDWAYADVDKLASLRGIQKQKKSDGKEGAYPKGTRVALLKALTHIQNLWLNVGQMEVYEGDNYDGRKRKTIKRDVQSRAFMISDRVGQLRIDGFMDVHSFRFQPGALFGAYLYGPGRQTALLSAKAIQYDPYRQKWEKRLARYLSWQWRVQARRSDYLRPYRVVTLLEAIGGEFFANRPTRTRERLEKALDLLQADEVIADWYYDRWDEKDAEMASWFEVWKKATILIKPPEGIINLYKSIERPQQTVLGLEGPVISQAGRGLKARGADNVSIAELIKNRRKKLGLSQLSVANILEVNQGYLSRVERGQYKPSQDIMDRILHWLNETGDVSGAES